MDKFMEIIGYILAFIGLACIVKHIAHQENCVLCGWHKTKENDEKPAGSRYGSNPAKY
jgi:hypothetical protein